MLILSMLAFAFAPGSSTFAPQENPKGEVRAVFDSADPTGRAGLSRLFLGTPNIVTVTMTNRQTKPLLIGTGTKFWTESLTLEITPPPTGTEPLRVTVNPSGLAVLYGLEAGDLTAILEPGKSTSQEFVFPDPAQLNLGAGSYKLLARITLPPERGAAPVELTSLQEQVDVVAAGSASDTATALSRTFNIDLKRLDFDSALSRAQQISALSPTFELTGVILRYQVLRDRGSPQDLADALTILENVIVPASLQRRLERPNESNKQYRAPEQTVVESLRIAVQRAQDPLPSNIRERNARLDAGSRLMLQGQFNAALIEARAAILTDASSWMPHFLEGILRARLRDFRAASSSLKEAEKAAKKDVALGNLKKPAAFIDPVLEQIKALSKE